MTDKTEKLNSALEHTRKAMNEIDGAASVLIQNHKLGSHEFDSLDEVYRALQLAEQRILELAV